MKNHIHFYMYGDSKITSLHDEIRTWVKARGGKPEIITSHTNNKRQLKIEFNNHKPSDTHHAISWEEFFNFFDNNNLLFLYQETTLAGVQSRFYKFIEKI